MTSVFIGGSRKILRLPQAVTNRLDNIVASDFTVLVGDADGVDLLVQKYLFAKHYPKVIVFCTGNFCRNNVGQWETRNVPTTTRSKGFQFYAVKDLAMTKDATYGFMIWDGKSKGTLNNILNLLQAGKKALVYFAPTQAFYPVGMINDLLLLLEQCDRQALELFEKELPLREIIKNRQMQREAIPRPTVQLNLNLDSSAKSENAIAVYEVETVLA